MRPIHSTNLFLLLASAATAQAAPVTTVPWNGHKGAVTFTFDDACPTHLTNVIPALDSRGQKATFFLIGNANFADKKSQWKAAALAGHELANHTTLHDDLRSLDSAKIATEIVDQAKALRAVDPSVEAVTLAYPYCGTNDLVNRIANRENIISRTCGGDGMFPWNTKPSEWMSMTSFILQDDASVPQALTLIDKAAADNSWLVTLNHGVGGDWNYIGTAQAVSMFDRAVASKAWVATYQTVAAYWRASKTMDTVTAKSVSGGWSLQWTSPHPRMPRSVKLRVKLDTAVFGTSPRVVQPPGIPVAQESDGTYVLEFMKLSVEIYKSSSRNPSQGTRREPRLFRDPKGAQVGIRDIPDGSYRFRFLRADGTQARSGQILAKNGMARVSTDADFAGVTALELSSISDPSRHWTLGPSTSP